MASSPLISALLAPQSPKRVRDPKLARAKTGEKAPAMTGQQHGELASYKEPTPAQRVKMHARDAKVSATRRWVDGDISTKAHAGIHARANRVLTNKGPKVGGRAKGW